MSEKVLIISNFHENSPISRSNMAYNFYRENGSDVTVLCSSFSHSRKEFREFDNADIVTLKTLPYSASLSLARIASYVIFSIKLYKFLGKNSFDLIYVNLPPNGVGLPLLMRKTRFKRLIVDVIDLWPEALPISNGYIKKSALYVSGIIPRIIRSRIVEYSDYCITESHYFYKKLDLGSHRNSGVIHIKKPELIEPKFVEVSDELSIVYLGNIGNIYDFVSLLEIIIGVRKKRKVFLHIIGLGPMLAELLASLNKENVDYFYHGASFDEDFKSRIISKCWFGFNGYKSNTEVALSYKSVDYLSYGVPLINSAKEDTRNLIDLEGIGYNYYAESLEAIIDDLSRIGLDDIRILKKRSYDVFRKSFSEESYRVAMSSVMKKVYYKELS